MGFLMQMNNHSFPNFMNNLRGALSPEAFNKLEKTLPAIIFITTGVLIMMARDWVSWNGIKIITVSTEIAPPRNNRQNPILLPAQHSLMPKILTGIIP
jgi:hypothetical protein